MLLLIQIMQQHYGVGKLIGSDGLKLKELRVGGFYSQSGLICSFFYQ